MRKLYKLFLISLLTPTFIVTSGSVLADYERHQERNPHFFISIGTPYYASYRHHDSAYYPYRNHHAYRHYRHCEWVQGHANHYGRWVPGHRVCW